MSLILVVEPDSLHAAQLQSMARAHLHAELLVADSADHAVAALAHRVPDIVLTAPLLPGHDEAVLANFLRALGDAAAHVQTLTIPILSAAAKPPERTMLGRFRRERPRMEDDEGCDPAMFADQIGQYLRRARQSRGEAPAPPPAPLPTASRIPSLAPSVAPLLPRAFVQEEEVGRALSGPPETPVDEPITLIAQPVPNHVPYGEALEADVLSGDVVDDRSHDAAGDAIEIDDNGEDVDLSELLNELSASALPPVTALTASRARPQPAEAPCSRPAWFDREVLVPTVLPRVAHSGEARTRVDEPRYRASEVPHRSNDAGEASPRANSRMQRESDAQPTTNAQPANVQQHMITIPSGNGGHVQASVSVSVAVAVQVSATTGPAAAVPKRRPRAPKPVQDEWGFFDPDQCGFRALIARLDAIAEVEEAD